MSSVLDIPLDKNPDVAALVADKSVGDRVFGAFTIKAKDDQTLSIRIEEMADNPSELPEKEDTNDEDDEDTETDDNDDEEETENTATEPVESQADRVAKKMSASNTGAY